MSDYFRLLGEPRRPWIDPEALKQKFLALSAEAHPDRFHHADDAARREAGPRFAELNAAYQCLRESKTRIAHLLQLERGAPPARVDSIPEETMTLFSRVAESCRELDGLLKERSTLTSPLLKAAWFEKAQPALDNLQGLLDGIRAAQRDLEARLKSLNTHWEATAGAPARQDAGELPLDEIERLYRQFGYLNRWEQQLQERFVHCSFP